MNDTINKLNSLFRLNTQAVIAVDKNHVVYSNSAADKLFGRDINGIDISGLLPGWPYEEGSVASAEFLSKKCALTISGFEGLMVININEICDDRESLFLPMEAGSAVAAAMTNLRMSIDRMASLGYDEGERELCYSVFYHNYYKLLRTFGHINEISAIALDKYPFSPQPIELGMFLSDIASSVRYLTEDLGIALDYEPPEELITINADGELLEQLVLGLICNSFQNTPRGGTVILRIYESRGRAVIAVTDNGSGIAPNVLSSVFLTDIPSGDTEIPLGSGGLGLPLASAIAAKHGGTVVLDSREGEGTTVRVMLKSSDKQSTTLRSPEQSYGNRIPVGALTELSVVLPRSKYTRTKILGKEK